MQQRILRGEVAIAEKMNSATRRGKVEGRGWHGERESWKINWALVEALFKISVIHGGNSRHPRGFWAIKFACKENGIFHL